MFRFIVRRLLQIIPTLFGLSLLALGGTQFTNAASLSFTNSNGCTYSAVTASATTSITVVTPSRQVRTIGFWGEHPELWSAELRARIQATDRRYDGIDGSTPDGVSIDRFDLEVR